MIAIRSFTFAALVVGLGFSGPAAAQPKVWNFSDTAGAGACSFSGGSGPGLGNKLSCLESTQQTPALPSLDVTAWGNTASGSRFAAGAVTGPWSGSGIGVGNASASENGTNASSGNADHSMDNANGNGNDLLLLKFTTAQVLSSVTVGWTGGDSDFQVLRWVGGASFDANVNLKTKTANEMVAVGYGWELVSTVDGINSGNTDKSYGVNSAGVSSSYWLISAFNSAFGGSAPAGGGADTIKLLAVGTGIPEPGSLALAGLALAGVAGLRRRSPHQAA